MALWVAVGRSRAVQGRSVLRPIYRDGIPVLRQTRREVRDWVGVNYGHLRGRTDLRGRRRMPVAVKAIIIWGRAEEE